MSQCTYRLMIYIYNASPITFLSFQIFSLNSTRQSTEKIIQVHQCIYRRTVICHVTASVSVLNQQMGTRIVFIASCSCSQFYYV